MLHTSNYPIDKIIQRDGKRALHNADVWSKLPWIFQRIRNEREFPQSEENSLLSVEVRTEDRLRLPLHPPIDASLISFLEPGDLAATRADIFVYKSDLWPGGPSRAHDINVIQRLCAVHLHNVILGHLHNASIRGMAPCWIFQSVFLVVGANRISSPFTIQTIVSRIVPSEKLARYKADFANLERVWNIYKATAAQAEESSAGCDDDLCTRMGHAFALRLWSVYECESWRRGSLVHTENDILTKRNYFVSDGEL